jgi:hypothetical protein
MKMKMKEEQQEEQETRDSDSRFLDGRSVLSVLVAWSGGSKKSGLKLELEASWLCECYAVIVLQWGLGVRCRSASVT